MRDAWAYRCPRCRQGSIFRGRISVNETCPVCHLKFEREQGYFLGAMIVSYALSIPFLSALALMIWLFTRWPVPLVLVAGLGVFLPFVPFFVRLSRSLWIYFDRMIDPE